MKQSYESNWGGVYNFKERVTCLIEIVKEKNQALFFLIHGNNEWRKNSLSSIYQRFV